MLTIYDSNGNRRTDIEAGDSSTQVKEVQGDNVLTLSFTHYEYIALDVNDRVDFEGERYWLTERYIPKQKSGQEWVYDLKFYGIESLVRRFLVLETTDGNTEPVFTLTATPREHVAMIVKCINDGMNHTTDWKVGRVDGTDLIVIDYEGKYCNEALKEIAEAVGGQAEWWVEGQTVNVCRCEHGEEITLGYGKGLTGIERDTTGTDNFYTRLFPVGSTRNIDPSKYGHSRLMLPGGRQYVEIHTEEYGIYDRYEQDAFSGIYPRRIGAVSSVRSEDVKDDDGNPFTVYYFRDDSLNFDPNDYELPDETKRVSFQDGDLSGLGQGEDHYFEVNFNSATREFEIITIWPYDDDTQLPGGKLIPKSGDRYILWNIRMPDEYYPLAEEEFLTAVEQFNTECWQDLAVYKAPTDHVWIEENGVSLSVGRRVRLESEEYFPETGYRSSRITKITRKVNQPGEMDIEISDALHSGAFERVNDSIGELKNYTKSKAEGAALPDIIRSWDKTLPTDNNLFSARRSQAEHISKKKNDRAKGKITFEAGASFGQEDNAGIDDKGNAELLTLVVREFLRSPKFVDGLFGEGWRLWMEDALSHLTIDKLTVRQVMVVLELLIEKVRSVGGQLCVSAANGKIKTAVLEDGYWRITFEQDNSFQAHDLMRCATFSGGNLKGYWVEVAGVEGDSILVSEDEFSGSLPEAGDECVLMGNTENPLRQNLILISATEDGQPRVDVMDGVKAKNFTGCLRARLGNLDGISDDWFPADNQPHGNGLYSDNAYLRGTFLLVTGEDIKTKFEIVEGRITSAVTALRNDFATEKGYLNNPAFDDGLEKWNTENETVFFLAGNRWIWANGNVLSKKGDGASVTVDDGRTVVRIRNKYILQKRANLKSVPSMPENDSGEKEAVPVYLTFFYRCAAAGTLRVEFENVDKTGFANFNSLEVEEELAATDGYVQYTCGGLWNGTGDFKLSFTGDIYLYMLVLSTDKVEALAYRYRTLLEQSDKLVRIAAENFDRDGNVLESSEIITSSKYNTLISERFNDDGSLKNTAGLATSSDLSGALDSMGEFVEGALGNYVKITSFAGLFASAVSDDENIVKRADISAFITEDDFNGLVSNIHLGADRITLEGLVTANGNFKVLEDGSIEAVNGKFTGEIDATGGTVGGFDISASSLQAVSGAESMYLSAGLMRFRNGENSVHLGSDVMPSSMGGMISCPMRVEVSRTSDSILYGNIGLYLDVSGSNAYDDQGYQYSGNHALYIPHGDICGLRLRVRRVSTSQTLSDMDSFIITVGSGDITLTLPSSPQDGQAYWFKQSASGTYTLAVGSSSHRINDGRTNSKSSWKVSDGCIVMLVWDKVNKQWCGGYSSWN